MVCTNLDIHQTFLNELVLWDCDHQRICFLNRVSRTPHWFIVKFVVNVSRACVRVFQCFACDRFVIVLFEHRQKQLAVGDQIDGRMRKNNSDLVIVTNRLSFHEFAKQGKLNAIHSNDYNAAAGQMPTVSTSSLNSHWCVCELLVYNKWQWRSRWRGGQWCPISIPLTLIYLIAPIIMDLRQICLTYNHSQKKDITPHIWQWSSRSPSRSIQPWSHLWTIPKVVPLWASLCHCVSWRMNVFWSRLLLFFL